MAVDNITWTTLLLEVIIYTIIEDCFYTAFYRPGG
jgi:hypothetical protein